MVQGARYTVHGARQMANGKWRIKSFTVHRVPCTRTKQNNKIMVMRKLKCTAFGTLILMLIVLATATVVEKVFGTETVLKQIYGAWWFVALWVVFVATSITYIVRRWMVGHRLSLPVLLLHVSFVVILLGALVTYLTGSRGYVHIRQGEIVNYYISEEGAVKHALPFDVKLMLFDIEYHPGTNEPADFISFLRVDGEVCQVSMNKIYKLQGFRLYQLSYDSDEMGTTLMVSHDPWGIGITYAGYFLLALSMILLLFIKIKWKGVLSTFLPVVGAWYYISQMNPMTPVLRSPMLAAHVSIIMIAYLLLLLIMILSIIGLCSEKRREKYYHWNSYLLYPAVFFLAAGIFIGAVWANISWGRYWGWDAKETWALITLLVYSLPFHKQSLAFFRDSRKYHIYSIVAFLSILMTFFGVSYILGGIHSYV